MHPQPAHMSHNKVSGNHTEKSVQKISVPQEGLAIGGGIKTLIINHL